MTHSSDDMPESNAGGSGGGSLADAVAEYGTPVTLRAISAGAWMKVAAILAAILAVNYRQVPILLEGWENPDWSHGYIIPLFSLYLLYVRRREILSTPRRIFVPGLLAVIVFAVANVLAYWVQNPLLCQLSAIFMLLSTALFLCGARLAILVAVPILFLSFALPIPSIIYSRIALPLQHLAAECAGGLISLFGGQVAVSASMMAITSVSGQIYPVEVAEACSGMKMLMAFLALGVAMAYLTDRPIWQRVVMVIMAVPVAVACNVIRVAITATMFLLDKKELGEGFMHEFTGLLMLIPAAILLWLVGRLLNAMVRVDVSPDSEPDRPADVTNDSSFVESSTKSLVSGGKFSVLAFPLVLLIVLVSGVCGNISKWIPKEPVCWPEAAAVSDGFRLTSFPDRVGDFVLVTEDSNNDGQIDGDIVYKSEDIKLLGMGDNLDQQRLSSRCANWYMSRVYRDSRINESDNPFKYWRLEVFYYTGRRDLVPHVAERCLAAAGAQVLESSDFSVKVLSPIPQGWPSVTPMRRVIFESFGGGKGWNNRYVQYYTFSMNGTCQTDWKKVRFDLASPLVRHCFFAKIQVAPLGRVDGVEDYDSPAADFCGQIIPAVLKYLPVKSDIEKLDATSTR